MNSFLQSLVFALKLDRNNPEYEAVPTENQRVDLVTRHIELLYSSAVWFRRIPLSIQELGDGLTGEDRIGTLPTLPSKNVAAEQSESQVKAAAAAAKSSP